MDRFDPAITLRKWTRVIGYYIIKAGRPFYHFTTQLVDKQVMDQRWSGQLMVAFWLTQFVAIDLFWRPRSNQVEFAIIKNKFLEHICHVKGGCSACLNLFCAKRAVKRFHDVSHTDDEVIKNPYSLLQ